MLPNSGIENPIITTSNSSTLVASNSILGVPKIEGRKPLDKGSLWCVIVTSLGTLEIDVGNFMESPKTVKRWKTNNPSQATSKPLDYITERIIGHAEEKNELYYLKPPVKDGNSVSQVTFFNSKGYKFYHPSSRKLLTSMDVTFFKHQSYYINTHLQGDNSIEDGMPLLHLNPTLSLPDFESPSAPAYSLNSTYIIKELDICMYARKKSQLFLHSIQTYGRKATRKCTQHPSSNFVSFHSLSPTQLFLSNLTTIESPKNVQEPLGNKNWRDVMNEEMHPLGKNGTWEMVELPRGKPIVGCIEVAQAKDGIVISQHKHIKDLLKEIGLLGYKPVETPIEQNHKLRDSKEELMVD
ncbi:hypothetical protein CK203_109433 [Vitis vinifera]|uniref:Retroviral polymerase SH3-like domain-containing protein n=1 Tax=Vitis vinifera TaxID=29760 RepID=A0A438CEF1_VITVI|nr:hypothetical protein CK203_109433 [Vitis vinifera]